MRKRSEFSAGLFLLLAVLLFGASIFLIGQERRIFSRQVEYFTTFQDVKGLAEGAPVRLGGITIGRVAKIVFPKDSTDPNIELTLYVDAEYSPRLRRDSEVSIETQGLLGDKFVSISTGAAEEQLTPGATLRHREAADISEVFEKAAQIVNQTTEIATNVNDLIRDVRTEALDNFSHAAKSIAEIMDAIQTKEGFAHQLIYNKEQGEKILGNLQTASDNLNLIMGEVRDGRGALHALIFDPRGQETVRAVTAAARELAKTADHLSDITAQIQSGKGLAHEVIFGESKGSLNETLKNLNETSTNLKKASTALANGSGTLGALLVDSQLYDNLVEVTGGAKRSFILRQAIRSSLKQGEKPAPQGTPPGR